MTGGYYSISSMFLDEPMITRAFQTGPGLPWGDHGAPLRGVEKFFQPAPGHIVSEWLPSSEGVVNKFKKEPRWPMLVRSRSFDPDHGQSVFGSIVGLDFHDPRSSMPNHMPRKSD